MKSLISATVGFVIFCTILLALYSFDRLPNLRPASLEETIILQQPQRAARSKVPKFIFIGDSSCLMGLDAGTLDKSLGRANWVNFATLSSMPLESSLEMLTAQEGAEPLRPMVVLILNPVMIGHPGSDLQTVSDSMRQKILKTANIREASRRLWNSVFPQVINGTYGRQYGFNTAVARWLEQHNGCIGDPNELSKPVAEEPDPAFSPYFLDQCSTFSNRFNRNFPLVIGFSPVPEGKYSPQYEAKRNKLLLEMADRLGATKTLNTPPTFPYHYFATSTHLRTNKAKVFTRAVVQQLTHQPFHPNLK